jgi:hypothetical protein
VRNRKLYSAFKSSLLYYGDDVFLEKFYHAEISDRALLTAIIKTAGKINGENSTMLLLGFLKNSPVYTDEIVQALWAKKAVINPHYHKLLNDTIISKLHNSNIKHSYYMRLLNDNNLMLLKEAILKEIKCDLFTLLRLYSFCYDSEKMNRIIQLIASASEEKFYNAIEMLELTLPKKYFTPTNHLIEWYQDVNHNKLVVTKGHKPINEIMEEIFSVNQAGLHSWTRSVACYTLLKIKKDGKMINSLKASSFSKDDLLFKETRNYVLSMLNN